MIFDSEAELKLLESQPEWCGVMDKVRQLNEQKNRFINQFDSNPKEWIQKSIENCDKEIKFFENILLFWSSNYTKLKSISEAVNRQVKAANEGEKLLSLIEDLNIAYDYERKENIILSETFIKLAKTKGIETEKIDKVLMDLRVNVRDYLKHINKKVNDIVNQ